MRFMRVLVMVFFVSAVLITVGYSDHGFTSYSWTCNGYVNIYYDSNGNGKYDSNDKWLPANKYLVDVGGKKILRLPKGVILKLNEGSTCTKSGDYHLCSNTASEYRSEQKPAYINVNKVSEGCTPVVTEYEYMEIIPSIDTLSEKQKLLDIYSNNFYADQLLTTKYSDSLDFFDVPTYIIPDITTPMKSSDFEKIINEDVINSILNYHETNYGYDCDSLMISTSMIELSCEKTEIVVINNATRVITTEYVGYLGLEDLYNELFSSGLVEINIIPVVELTYQCPSGSSPPQVIATKSKEVYISQPGDYECRWHWMPNNVCVYAGT